MDFAYTPALTDLRDRATRLTGTIQAFELACEEGNGLPPEAHAVIADAVRAESLHAINMPTEWGGAGSDAARAGRRPGAAGPAHERPLGHRLAPGERAEGVHAGAARALARSLASRASGETPSPSPRSSPGATRSALRTTARRDGDEWVIDGVKWFVTVGDVADYFLVLALAGGGPRTDDVPRRQGHPRRLDRPDPALHAHLRLRAPRVRLRRRRASATSTGSARSARGTS